MAKKILIAFDESENAMRAVDFVGSHFAPDAEVMLLSVLLDTQALCDMHSPELTPYFKSEQSAFCTLEDKKKEVVSQAMQAARRGLINCGFAADKVHTKSVVRQKGIARDIIKTAQDGGYSVVVMGKAGLSGIKEFFMGSVSQKVAQGAKNVSVVLVE